jgi:hydrogenase/urease accessory protein HupE
MGSAAVVKQNSIQTMMWQRQLALSLVLVLSSLLGAAIPAQAHDLLPENIYQYLHDNPDASQQDIQAFIAGNAPELAEKYSTDTALNRLIERQDAGWWQTIQDFIQLGIEHILSGPDHILFVLSLLLVFVSWRHIFKLTGTFTLAHSVTLLLAGTGLITLSANIVEPLIALSIAVVALATVFFKSHPWLKNSHAKFAAVFFFGLFHGLGFAGVLSDVHIPDNQYVLALLSFNFGIELGQIFIIVLAVPFIYALRDKVWYPRIMQIAALLISALAMIWFVQRLL